MIWKRIVSMHIPFKVSPAICHRSRDRATPSGTRFGIHLKVYLTNFSSEISINLLKTTKADKSKRESTKHLKGLSIPNLEKKWIFYSSVVGAKAELFKYPNFKRVLKIFLTIYFIIFLWIWCVLFLHIPTQCCAPVWKIMTLINARKAQESLKVDTHFLIDWKLLHLSNNKLLFQIIHFLVYMLNLIERIYHYSKW